MVIHELTTNAAKYGALSSSSGTIEIRWTLEAMTLEAMAGNAEVRLTLNWHERGGPQIEPPDKMGFGSILIERLIVRQFGGTAKFEFARDGLLFRGAFPIPIAAEPADGAFPARLTKR